MALFSITKDFTPNYGAKKKNFICWVGGLDLTSSSEWIQILDTRKLENGWVGGCSCACTCFLKDKRGVKLVCYLYSSYSK